MSCRTVSFHSPHCLLHCLFTNCSSFLTFPPKLVLLLTVFYYWAKNENIHSASPSGLGGEDRMLASPTSTQWDAGMRSTLISSLDWQLMHMAKSAFKTSQLQAANSILNIFFSTMQTILVQFWWVLTLFFFCLFQWASYWLKLETIHLSSKHCSPIVLVGSGLNWK